MSYHEISKIRSTEKNSNLVGQKIGNNLMIEFKVKKPTKSL